MIAVAAAPSLGHRTLAVLDVLLDHHRGGGGPIAADALCARAGMPGFASSVAISLVEIAQWCADRGWPPLNALVVNPETGKPGAYYRLAAACSVLGWRDELAACLAFRGYPAPSAAYQGSIARTRIGAMRASVARRLSDWLGPR